MAETKSPLIVEEDLSDSGSPEAMRGAVQQFVIALAQRSKISKPVVAEKMVGCGLDMMVSYLGREVVAHWLRRCAGQLEADQVEQGHSTAS